MASAIATNLRVPAPIWANRQRHEARSHTVVLPASFARGVNDMAGKFELYKSSSGEYRFRLKATNGQIIATGEGYKTKASALNGIESVRKNAATAQVDDQTA